MPSNTRIQCLRHQRDFNEATDGASGLQIVTNVSFDGNAPEAIRLNLAAPNSSLRRSNQRSRFSRIEAPFKIHNPAVLLSSEQLACLQKNFAVVQEALGGSRLGKISIESPIHESILPMMQARSYEILWIDSILESLSLDSALLRSYLRHPQTLRLFELGEASEQAVAPMEEVKLASELYSQLPELRDYADQDDVQVENIGPRGEQFRKWLQQNNSISNDGVLTLDYVAYAPRPLRISGCKWNMGQSADRPSAQEKDRDLRKMAVDLLLRFEGYPVWCEVKAKGDTWTSSALQQILLYGSMLASANQKRRCHRYFADHFLSFKPWLGILVEDRDDSRFLADYEQTLSFAQTEAFQNTLETLFGGIVFGMIQETEAGWTLSRSEVIRW